MTTLTRYSTSFFIFPTAFAPAVTSREAHERRRAPQHAHRREFRRKSFGFDTALISRTTHAPRDVFPFSPLRLPTPASSALSSTLRGALLAGQVVDRRGSRHSRRAAGLPRAISTSHSALAPSFSAFVVCLTAAVIAIGAPRARTPPRLAEIAPVHRCGAHIGLFLVFPAIAAHSKAGQAEPLAFITGSVPLQFVAEFSSRGKRAALSSNACSSLRAPCRGAVRRNM